MAYTPKTFHAINIYFNKVKNPPDEFCTHLFFDSAIILIFGGILLYKLYIVLKYNLKWFSVPKIDFARQK